MVLGTATDPFRAIYLDKAVQDIIESLGIRHGKEIEFIQIVLSFVEKSYSNVKLAREAVTDEELSRVFIHKFGERIWSDKNLVKIYYRVEWSRFAGIAAILFAPTLSRLWPILQSASDIQFSRKSVLGMLPNTRFPEDAGQQQKSPKRGPSECGSVTTQGSGASSSDLSNFSTSTSQECRFSTTPDSAAVPRPPLGAKVPPNPIEDVPFSTTTAVAGRRAADNSPSSPQVLHALLTPANASEQMLKKKLVRERRDSAIKLRLAENASPVAELKEKIRLTVETMGQTPEKEPEDLSEQRRGQKPYNQTSLDWLLFDGTGKPTVRLPVVDPRWSAFPTVPGPEDPANGPERPETVPSSQAEQLLLSSGSRQTTVHLPAADPTHCLFFNVAGRKTRSNRPGEPETVPSDKAERLLLSSGQVAAVRISRVDLVQRWATRFEQLRNQPIPETVPSNQAEGLLLSDDSGRAAAVRLPSVNPRQNHVPYVPGRQEQRKPPATPDAGALPPKSPSDAARQSHVQTVKKGDPLSPGDKRARTTNDGVQIFLEVGQVVAGVRRITGDENFGDQLVAHLRKVTWDKTLGESRGTRRP